MLPRYNESMIIGIDEVGRGCWAGPLVAAAVALPDVNDSNASLLAALRDSKMLSRAQRTKLAAEIRQHAVAIGIGWVSAARIDFYGLTAAVRMAMEEALNASGQTSAEVVIDGNFNFLQHLDGGGYKISTLIKADATVPAVSAASIIAKVARDEHMSLASRAFPEYGFEKHVGYGTALHRAALAEHGICELHRLSVKPVKALVQLTDE
ncbi:MAG: Ribonuclease [Candidatus Saccharibacteria bacterium]|nr:Ribonuclease [Candidatus Saccharibacteria bacterium]